MLRKRSNFMCKSYYCAGAYNTVVNADFKLSVRQSVSPFSHVRVCVCVCVCVVCVCVHACVRACVCVHMHSVGWRIQNPVQHFIDVLGKISSFWGWPEYLCHMITKI